MPRTHSSTAAASPLSLVALLFFLHHMLPAYAQEHWPQFRGPEARGVARGPNLPDRWSATENIAWKTDVPGRGWSSPIVWGNRVFLTTAVNSGELETPKKGLYFGGNRPEPRRSAVDYKVICLDLTSGKMLWERSVHQGPAEQPDSPQEQLRLGDAGDRWRAGLRLLRQPGLVLPRSRRER